jgi:hypothetical protein
LRYGSIGLKAGILHYDPVTSLNRRAYTSKTAVSTLALFLQIIPGFLSGRPKKQEPQPIREGINFNFVLPN